MEHGTTNHVLNKAFICAKSEMHEWMEGIKHLLMRNGMGNAWENPNNLHEQSFPKLFKQRLDDQYVQKWFSK
jgi:hypothetical protein